MYQNLLDNKKILLVNNNKKKLEELNSFLENIEEFKVNTYISNDLNESILISKNFKPDLVISSYTFNNDRTALDLFENLDENVVKVLFVGDLSFKELESIVNKGRVFKFLDEDIDYSSLKETIKLSLQQSTLISQNKFLQEKVKSQVSKINNLQKIIKEKKVLKDKKTKSLKDDFLSREINLINDIFLSFQKILSFEELENIVLDKLSDLIKLKNVKISLKTSYEKNSKKEELILPLFSSNKVIGSVKYLKKDDVSFNKNEIDFLDQVSDIIAGVCERLINYKEIEQLKENWDFIFNSIKSPVLVLDKNLNIVKENKTFTETKVFFLKKLNKIIQELNLKEVLKENKAKTKVFNFETKAYSISAYPFKEKDIDKLIVLFFKDITEQRTYQDKILYSEKLAELGIVSGSLAHEINNPIGGILMLLSMMIEDISKDEKIYDDLVEMEKAAKRCKDIAENLLGFSRRSRDEDLKPFEISKVFQAILPLINMKVKNKGIDILTVDESLNAKVNCVFNELLQAILNLINISIAKIVSNSKKGKIELKSYVIQEEVCIEILDNFCEPIVKENDLNDLSLFISKKIIETYKGKINYSFDKKRGNLFKICFSLTE